MSLTSDDATARLDLGLRIEGLLDKRSSSPVRELTSFQSDRVLLALRQLKDGYFADGQWAMLQAERADLFEPNGYASRGKPATVEELAERLKRVLENKG